MSNTENGKSPHLSIRQALYARNIISELEGEACDSFLKLSIILMQN